MAVDEFAGNGAEMQAHTPGPWVIIPPAEYDGDDEGLAGSYTYQGGIEGSDGSPVCMFGDPYGSGMMFENEADHRLIAAAPDLAAVARAYEAWEADLILNGDWSNELPRMTQAQYDRLLEIQAMRNAALRKAGGNANG